MAQREGREVHQELSVDQYTLGLVGPDQEWAETVADGGTPLEDETETDAEWWNA